jgi:hypothetical protein
MRIAAQAASWACLLSACGELSPEVSERFLSAQLPRPYDAPRFSFAERGPISVARPVTVPGFAILPATPGAQGYVVRNGVTPYAFDGIDSPGGDPFVTDTIEGALPFAFPYFGTEYAAGTPLLIASSGSIWLDPPPDLWPLPSLQEMQVLLPSFQAPPTFLAPFWGSWVYLSGLDGHADGLTVSASLAKYTLAWVADYSSDGTGAGATGDWGGAELALYPSGRIRVRYAGPGGPQVNVGIQDASRSRGMAAGCAPDCGVGDGIVYTFYPEELAHPELAMRSERLPPVILTTTATPAFELGYSIHNSGTAPASVVLTLLYRDDTALRESINPYSPQDLYLTSGVYGGGLAGSIAGPAFDVGPGQTIAGVASFDLTGHCLYCLLDLYAAPADPEDDDGDRLLPLGAAWLFGEAEILTTALPDAPVGQAYQVQLESNVPLSWESLSLPPFLALSSDGVLSGTPTSAGVYSVDVTAGSPATTTARRTFSLTVR